MRVLVACEFSGVVRDAFAARGHEVISCDLLDTQSERWHYNGDVFDIIHYPFDLMVAHPPCTHLSVSGARHFTEKRKDGRQTEGGVTVNYLRWHRRGNGGSMGKNVK